MFNDHLDDRFSLVLLTYNSAAFIERTLERLLSLGLPIFAVDNGSTDQTVSLLKQHREIELITLPKNIGAAARNYGVERARTPYVAFCDDDTWWDQAGLSLAAKLFDHYPHLGLITAKILVGPQASLDPISELMARSPLPDRHGLPGTVLMSFMGGASVVRKRAYLEAGGYDPRFFIGGEEETLGWKLARRGWQMRYVDQITCYHYPSLQNYQSIRHFGLRNTIVTAWLHRPTRSALHWTRRSLTSQWRHPGVIAKGLWLSLKALPWIWRERSVMPPELEHNLQILEFGKVKWPQSVQPAEEAALARPVRSRLRP